MNEQNFMKLVMLHAAKKNITLFRNNSGNAWMGKTVDHPTISGAKIIFDARPVKFGVGNPGGSDLIGYNNEGRFIAYETKTLTGRATPEQINFIEQVEKNGGIGRIIRKLSDI